MQAFLETVVKGLVSQPDQVRITPVERGGMTVYELRMDASDVGKVIGRQGVMINTIGIGSPEGSPIIDRATHETRKDAQGNTIITKLNEAELQELAQNTNGVYIRLDDADDAAAKITAQLATIEQKAMGDKSFADYKSYFQLFLGAALLFLLIETFIPERKMTIA